MNSITDVSVKVKNLGLIFGSLLLMAVVTTYIVSAESKEVLVKKSYDSLISARESKSIQIENFFKERIGDINVLAKNGNVAELTKDLLDVQNKLEVGANEKYPVQNAEVQEHTLHEDHFFQFYAKEYNYYDIFYA